MAASSWEADNMMSVQLGVSDKQYSCQCTVRKTTMEIAALAVKLYYCLKAHLMSCLFSLGA